MAKLLDNGSIFTLALSSLVLIEKNDCKLCFVGNM